MSVPPPGWELRPVGEVAEVVLGQSPPGTSYNDTGDGVPFFQGKAEFGSLYPTVQKWTTEPKKHSRKNDVLISVRAPVGPTNLAPLDCAVGRGLAALRAPEGMSAKYLLYAVRASVDALASQATGTTFAAVTGKQLRAHEIVVAPSGEQQQIVDAIEEQLSRLDAGVESLQRAKRNLTRLRASILAAAARGELGLADGRTALEPERWNDVTLNDLLIDIEAGKSFKALGRSATNSEWGVIKVSAMTWGEFRDLENKALLPETNFDSAFEIFEGDLLLSRANTSEYVGATVLVEKTRPRLLLSDKSMRLHVRSEVNTRWLWYTLLSPPVRAQMSAVATGTSDSMRNISQAKVRNLTLRVPPQDEQRLIIAEVDRQLSIVGAIAQAVDDSLTRCVGLKRSVLKDAFSGCLAARLGPGNPVDHNRRTSAP